MTARDAARVLLAAVRIANGSASLLAPAIVARRLGAAPETANASLYPLRLFGIRTVVVGAELLLRDPSVRRMALDGAVVIHASDTLAALLGGVRRELPQRQAAMLTALSAGNTALALVARGGLRRGPASPARDARG